MVADLSKLTTEELMRNLAAVCETNRLYAYQPYQWQKEFHNSGSVATERLLIAANGVGKSFTIAAETAMHATGLYPDWWRGARFDDGGFEIWPGSIDSDMQKIGLQDLLMGPDLTDRLGTGMLPRRGIQQIHRRQAAIKDVLEETIVRHASGNPVKIRWRTFEQGEKKWQSGKPKIIVWDEEPDENNVEQKGIFSEMQTRLVRNAGIFFGGRTPLYGMTQLIEHFMQSTNPAVRWFGATWDDAPHMDEAAKAKALEAYPEHERATRSKGVPMMGQGAIFAQSESTFVIDPIELQPHWARITGIDFGLAHPAAVACWAWDRDANVKYLYYVWRDHIRRTIDHCEVIKGRGDWIPVAWPHDGEKRDPKSGERLADAYRNKYGCNMLSKSARYKNDKGGGQAQWPIIEDIRAELAAGTVKVFRTCTPWLEEYRNYHTKDGIIVAKRDDALKASFYAFMMLRYAQAKPSGHGSFDEAMSMAPFTTGIR